MKNEIINLVERFKSFLIAEAQSEKPQEPIKEELAEEKEIDAEYVIEGTDQHIIVYKDGTVGGDVVLEPNKEYLLVGNQVLITDENGNIKEIKALEIPEEEKPIETDVTLVEEPVEDTVESDKDALIESLMKEVETLTAKIAELEGEKEQLSAQKAELESQIPTVVAGVEIKQSEQSEQTQETKQLSLNDLLKANFNK